jgi:hypothetical protein
MKKQTAVEWFQKEMLELEIKREAKGVTVGEFAVQYFQLFEQAKAIEKEQIIDAFFGGYNYEGGRLEEKSEEYYTETYIEPKND